METTRILFVIRDDGDMTEPMNIMLLSALSKRDAPWRTTHRALLERDDILRVMDDVKPHIVACSAITGSHRAYLEAIRVVKERYGDSVLTVLGGPYCSSYPGVIAKEPYLDAIGYLECDEAWPAFLEAYESGGGRIHEIPNMITRENHHRVLRPVEVPNPKTGQPHIEYAVDPSFYRPRLTDLDSLPYLDRDLIYRNTLFGGRLKRTHMAGRGCPFKCTYCFEHTWNKVYLGKGKVLQRYSPVRYCEELARVKRDWPTRFIKHYDDVFPVFPPDREWLEEFAEVYPKLVGLPFHCLVRCDLVVQSPWALPLLKRAGVFSLTMSIESGNAFIRDHVIARDMAHEEIEQAFGEAHKLGIRTFSNTILGIPGPKIPKVGDPNFDARVEGIVNDSKLNRPARRVYIDLGKALESARLKFDGDPVALRRFVANYLKDTGAKVKLSDALDEARRQFEGDLSAWRRFVVDYLRSVGLHETQLEYDFESVLYSIGLGVNFGEFGILFPYPWTDVTEKYLIPRGWFDGDYDKLHASYQARSPLTCFTEDEKTAQENMALLGTAMILMTGSQNRFVRWFGRPFARFALPHLSRIRSRRATAFFQWLYTATKIVMHEKRVYPMHLSAREKWKFFLETWKLDVWKRFRRKHHQPVLRGSRPGSFLGGPPSV
ncbi:MAG: hypothetical protein A2122_02770 [Candidatus Liptonbacteria bacterium GWB1_49_6]|uniref:B12-binding domain-containing protein n=1 Tax=Candidatus Liptonbacteria bacterium GWB1_49_6 TaxID=1798644 RepID=A0A1G2C7K7_9BACT|nr:MAG: hypothetical protein A2122_02770 [Candidatus Liptonbacteria bacterium GWB1_49_6]